MHKWILDQVLSVSKFGVSMINIWENYIFDQNIQLKQEILYNFKKEFSIWIYIKI